MSKVVKFFKKNEIDLESGFGVEVHKGLTGDASVGDTLFKKGDRLIGVPYYFISAVIGTAYYPLKLVAAVLASPYLIYKTGYNDTKQVLANVSMAVGISLAFVCFPVVMMVNLAIRAARAISALFVSKKDDNQCDLGCFVQTVGDDKQEALNKIIRTHVFHEPLPVITINDDALKKASKHLTHLVKEQTVSIMKDIQAKAVENQNEKLELVEEHLNANSDLSSYPKWVSELIQEKCRSIIEMEAQKTRNPLRVDEHSDNSMVVNL